MHSKLAFLCYYLLVSGRGFRKNRAGGKRCRCPIVILRQTDSFPRFEKLWQVVCQSGVETCPEFARAAQKECEHQSSFGAALPHISTAVAGEVGLVVVNIVLGLELYGELPPEPAFEIVLARVRFGEKFVEIAYVTKGVFQFRRARFARF